MEEVVPCYMGFAAVRLFIKNCRTLATSITTEYVLRRIATAVKNVQRNDYRCRHTLLLCARFLCADDLRSLHARHQAQRPLEGVRGKDQEQHLVVKGWTTQTESPRACTFGAANESGTKRCVRL